MQWTGDDAADTLVSTDPLALLIGFCLDQQVTVEKAFRGPLDLRERLGTLDARQLAAVDPGHFEEAFRTRPALHRFPASMAQRVQALCAIVAGDYENDASRIWTTAKDAAELEKRLRGLPGFGDMKARIVLAVIGKHLGVKPRGWAGRIPDWPTLADVSTVEQRQEYQAGKRAWKAEMRARGELAEAPRRRRG